MIGSTLLRYNNTQEYLTLDAETGGLNLYAALPWQFSFVTYTLKKDLETHNYYPYWKEEDLRMSRGAAIVTRFNYKDYEDKADDPKKILEIVEDYINSKKYKLANHNLLGYDSMIINNWRRKLGLKPRGSEFLVGRAYDTHALMKAYKMGAKPDLSSDINFLAWQFRICGYVQKGLKSSILVMCKEFEIEVDETQLHNSLVDVTKNKEGFKQLLWKMEL